MSLLGVQLSILIGPTVALPIGPDLASAVVRVQVDIDDTEAAGCQITFQVGKPSSLTFSNDLTLRTQVTTGARVVLVLTAGAIPSVLFDGVITRKELNPGGRPGESTLTVTAVDLTHQMDLEEKSVEHPAQPDMVIATMIIGSYGLIPMVIPPVASEVPLVTERIPVQQGTDLAYLRELAAQNGYVFYIIPGPLPMVNTGYWGPPIRVGLPQSALTVDMGAFTNVERFDVSVNGDGATLVSGEVMDRLTCMVMPVMTVASTRIPLGRSPVLSVDPTKSRTKVLRDPGVSAVAAFARAQATTDASTDAPLSASGTLDTARYGGVLQPRALVGVRGVTDDYDGFWYVKRVSHKMSLGSYKQDFTLTRGEMGALLPLVVP